MVGGDSAGGNLAAVVAISARDGKRSRYRGPGADLSGHRLCADASLASRAGDQHPADALRHRWFRDHYLNGAADVHDWRASPARARTLIGLPPAYVLTAGADPLRDEGNEYAPPAERSRRCHNAPDLSRPVPRLLHDGQVAAAGQCRGRRNRRLAEGAELERGLGHGAKDMDEVEIVNYDPRWPVLFNKVGQAVAGSPRSVLIVGLEHFGSTAVPNLSAKPIIDILIAVRSLTDAQATLVEALRNLDYVYWADNPKKDRMFSLKACHPFGSRRSHHVHVTEPMERLWQRLAFRDYFARSSRGSRDVRAAQRRLAAAETVRRIVRSYTDAKICLRRKV